MHSLLSSLYLMLTCYIQFLMNPCSPTSSNPLSINSCPDFPVIQYADDTILVMPAMEDHMVQAKSLLSHFAAQIGLKITYNKSVMVPINVSIEKMISLVNTLGCHQGSFPFTYLGVPLNTSKSRLEDFTPICRRIEKNIDYVINYDIL